MSEGATQGYVPIASMTNPPANWGYARTVTGFLHVLTRGQYERIYPTSSLQQLGEQFALFGQTAIADLGLEYLIVALIPLACLPKVQTQHRRWMLGVLVLWVCLTFLLLVVLSPGTDRQSRDLFRCLFTAAHVPIAMWAGCGLILLGSKLAGARAVQRLTLNVTS